MFKGIAGVALAIVGVSLVATVVVNGGNTAKVVSATGNAFSQSLTAAQKG